MNCQKKEKQKTQEVCVILLRFFFFLKKEKNPHASFHLGYNVSLSELQEQCIEGHYESIAIGTIKHTLSM